MNTRVVNDDLDDPFGAESVASSPRGAERISARDHPLFAHVARPSTRSQTAAPRSNDPLHMRAEKSGSGKRARVTDPLSSPESTSGARAGGHREHVQAGGRFQSNKLGRTQERISHFVNIPPSRVIKFLLEDDSAVAISSNLVMVDPIGDGNSIFINTDQDCKYRA